MAAVIGALRAELSASIAKFMSDMGTASGGVAKFASKFDQVGRRMQGVGTALTVGITAPFAALISQAVPAAVEASEASAQVEAALRSMGNASGRTKEQLDASAEALMRMSTFDDDEILRKVTANLLTFGQVSGEQFDRAQRAVVDLATRLNMDLQPATLLVGKALNDPIQGLTALRRTGIQFTEEQQAMIRQMTAVGNVAGAQGIILGELERQFGGSAKAARDAAPGSDLINSWDNFKETLGAIVLNVLPPLTDFLNKILEGFNNLSPGMQTFALGAAAVAAAVGPVLVVLGTLISTIAGLIPLFTAGGIFASGGAMAGVGAIFAGIAAAIGPVILIVGALVAAFLLFKDDLIPVFNAFKAKFSEVLGPQFGELIATARQALTELWEGPLGQGIRAVIGFLGDLLAAFASVLGEGIIRILNVAIQYFTGFFENVQNGVRLIAALLRGDWAAAWDAAKAIVQTTVRTLLNILDALVPGAVDAMRRLYEGVRDWLQARLVGIFTGVIDKIRETGDAFFRLYDRVVGHSYIPDMVIGIAEWMGKLPEVMVRPAEEAADATASAFESGAERVTDAVETMATDAAETTTDVWKKATEEIGSNLADMIRQGEVSLNGLLAMAVEVLSKIGSDQFGGINFGGGGGGSSGGFDLGKMISDGLGKIISGFRANGGPVMAGRSYIVGENGPELFTPNSSGGITANEAAGGPVVVNINGVQDPTAWRKSRVQLAAEIGRAVATGRRGM